MLELYLKLKELGHPHYISEGAIEIPSIPCSNHKEEVDVKVQEIQLLVTKWNHEVSHLRASYTWLLYFSMPKILQLNQLIQLEGTDPEKVDRIVHEVSFLTISQPLEREKLSEGVKVCEDSRYNLHPYGNVIIF